MYKYFSLNKESIQHTHILVHARMYTNTHTHITHGHTSHTYLCIPHKLAIPHTQNSSKKKITLHRQLPMTEFDEILWVKVKRMRQKERKTSSELYYKLITGHLFNSRKRKLFEKNISLPYFLLRLTSLRSRKKTLNRKEGIHLSHYVFFLILFLLYLIS